MNPPTTDSSDLESPERKPGLGALLTKGARGASIAARRIGERLGGIATDGTRLARHEVNDKRLRRQLDERYRALGRVVYQIHKHARDDSPFESLAEVKSELTALETALAEYRTNREERAQVREQLRRSRR